MNPSMIGNIILGLIIFIVVVSFLFGLKRGFKKTLFRMGWLLLCALILWFATPAISNWLNTFDLSSLALNIYGPVNKLSDIGINILNNLNLDPEISSSPAVISFMENAPVLLLNIFTFVLVFFLTKWLLWPLCAFISSRLFDKEKRARKKYQKKLKELKKQGLPLDEENSSVPPIPKPNRVGGGLMGIVMGLLLSAVCLSPIVGLNSIYQTVNASVTTTNSVGEEVPYLPTVINDDKVLAYINCFENSPAQLMLRYTGMEFLSKSTFNNLASFKVKNQKITLSSELGNGINIYNKVLKIQDFISHKDTVEDKDLDSFLTNLKELLRFVKSSKLVTVLGDDLLDPLIQKHFVNNENIHLTIGSVDYAPMLKKAYSKAIEEEPMNVNSLTNQLNALVDVGIVLDNNNLVLPLMQGSVTTFDDAINLIKTNINSTANFSRDLIDSLFRVTMLKSQYATLVDDLMKNVYETLKIGTFVPNETIDVNKLSQSSKVILESALNFFKHYSKDFNFGDNTSLVLSSLGKVIDGVKQDILSSESYKSLLTYIETKINDAVKGFVDLSTAINAEILGTISKWEDECRSIAPLYNTIINQIKDETFTVQGILDGSFKGLPEIGNSLQAVVNSRNSQLINNRNLRNIFEALLNELENTSSSDPTKTSLKDYLAKELASGETIKQYMLNNIWNDSEKTSKIDNWGNELQYTFQVITKINDTLIGFNKDELIKDDNNKLELLGESLSLALDNTNLFISPEVLKVLMGEFFTTMRNEASFAELNNILNIVCQGNGIKGTTVYDQLLNNIFDLSNQDKEDKENMIWKEELKLFKNNLLKVDFATENLSLIGKTLDNLYLSKMFSRPLVREIVLHYIDREANKTTTFDKTLLEKVMGMVTDILNAETAQPDGTYNIKFEQEIGYIQGLVKVINDTSAESDTNKKFGLIGDELDKIAGLPSAEVHSNLFTKKVLNEFIAHYITEFANKFQGTENSELTQEIIKIMGVDNANLMNINSYAAELQAINKFSNALSGLNDLVQIGESLDTIVASSNVITTETIKPIICHYIDKKVSTELNKYSGALEAIKNNVNNNIPANKYAGEFQNFKNLQDDIASGIILSNVEGATPGMGNDAEGEKYGIGKTFDDLISGKNPSGYITKDVINIILSVEINSKIEENKKAYPEIEVLSSITNNLNEVASYETELSYVDKLINIVKEANPEQKLGKLFDDNKESKLIKKNSNLTGNPEKPIGDVDKLIWKFIDKGLSDKNDVLDVDIIRGLKMKAITASSCEIMFNEFKVLGDYLGKYNNISVENFKTQCVQMGTDLDDMSNNLTNIVDKDITHKIAEKLFTQIKEKADQDLKVIINNELDAANFNAKPFNPEDKKTYYTDLMTAINTAITAPIV